MRMQEDDRLRQLVESLPEYPDSIGSIDWRVAAAGSGRSTKQCRERWVNVLDPSIVHTRWTEAELEALFTAHAELGNKWSAIALRIPGRYAFNATVLFERAPRLVPISARAGLKLLSRIHFMLLPVDFSVAALVWKTCIWVRHQSWIGLTKPRPKRHHRRKHRRALIVHN